MRPLGETGRLGDLQRWGSTESYTLRLRSPGRCQEVGKNQGPHSRDRRKAGGGRGPQRVGGREGSTESAPELGERETRDSASQKL